MMSGITSVIKDYLSHPSSKKHRSSALIQNALKEIESLQSRLDEANKTITKMSIDFVAPTAEFLNSSSQSELLEVLEERNNETARAEKAEASNKVLREALEFLIEVKIHKGEYGKDKWYRENQPVAWEQAKKALIVATEQGDK